MPRVWALLYNALYALTLRMGWTTVSAWCAARAATAHINPSVERPTVLVSGLGRSGKTILANQLVQEHRYRRVCTDDCLHYFFQIEDDDARLHFREAFYGSIIRRFPRGLVIEGDDFILKNRRALAAIDHPVDASITRTLTERFGIKAFFLGNTGPDVNAVIRSFEAYSSHSPCYTTSLPDVRKYAEWLIRVSLTLRDLADGGRIHYLETDPADFDGFIAEVAARIAGQSPLSLTVAQSFEEQQP